MSIVPETNWPNRFAQLEARTRTNFLSAEVRWKRKGEKRMIDEEININDVGIHKTRDSNDLTRFELILVPAKW